MFLGTVSYTLDLLPRATLHPTFANYLINCMYINMEHRLGACSPSTRGQKQKDHWDLLASNQAKEQKQGPPGSESNPASRVLGGEQWRGHLTLTFVS